MTSGAAPSFVALPVETIVRIFGLGDARTLLKCLQVCRHIHDIISNSVALQYKIELFAQGMHDNAQIQDGANTADLLAMLTTYGDALKELAWTNYETIDLTDASIHTRYVSDGILVLPSREKKITGTWLDVYQLPSALRGVPARQWTLKFEFSVTFFTVDVASDLLVLCEYSNNGVYGDARHRVHLRSLSTGDVHLRSQSEGLKVPENFLPKFGCLNCKVYADYLALLMYDDRLDFLFVWNWCTGTLLFQLEIKERYGYCFLDDAHLALLTWPDELGMGGENLNKLLIYSLSNSESLCDPVDVLTPHLEAIFNLPSIELEIEKEGRTAESCCRCDARSHALPVGQFYADMEDSVLSFAVPLRPGVSYEELDNLELHIPTRLLLNHDLVTSGTGTAVTAPEVPLHMWGDKVCINLRTQTLDTSLNGLPSTFSRRSVMFTKRERPWPHPRSSSSKVPSESPDAIVGTVPDIATLLADKEPCWYNILVLADHHPRRVARALAHNDEHITFGLTLKPPFDVVDLIPGEMEARRKVRSAQRGTKQAPYIRSEAVLPDELQGWFDPELYAAMCGDAVLVFQDCTEETWDWENVYTKTEKIHIFTF